MNLYIQLYIYTLLVELMNIGYLLIKLFAALKLYYYVQFATFQEKYFFL